MIATAKWEETVYTSEWFLNKPLRIQEFMRQWPPWEFYERTGCGAPVRVYGVAELTASDKDGLPILALHAVVAHWCFPVKLLNPFLPEEVKPVVEWSPYQLAVIQSLSEECRFAFREKSAWVHCIDTNENGDDSQP